MRIKRIIAREGLSKSFELEPLNGWEPKVHSGQFITLVFFSHGKEKRRSYSFSSCPELGEPLIITVKKVDNGEFSRHLNYVAKEGDEIKAAGTGGFFTAPETGNHHTVFFTAAGSGITPCFSLIKYFLAFTNHKLVLVYSNKTREETIFYEELEAFKRKYSDRFFIHYFTSNSLNYETARLSSERLEKILAAHLPAEKEKGLFYICGPFFYRQTVMITLLRYGIKRDQIRREDFDPYTPPRPNRPPDTDGHYVTIHLKGETHKLFVQYPKSITQTAREAGIALPFSCEAGRCGSCVATCTDGKVWMQANEVLMEEEIKNGRVLTCVGYPVHGDAEVMFDNA